MRIHVFVLFILFINSFGLQAQNRDSSPLDCTKEEFIFARTITYTNLEAQKEYMLLFPHHEYLESSVDNLLSEQHAKNVYWKKNKLYFTATQEFVYFDYPGITKDLQVINCSDFYICSYGRRNRNRNWTRYCGFNRL